ncbi:MAG: DUF445 family protein [Planctomycetota bacterium]
MLDSAMPWIMLPAVGALIGYGTNYLAVRMIFRPIKPVRVLGFTLQGLVPRRQAELAASIGRVVGDHLFSHDDMLEALGQIDLAALVDTAFDKGLAPKIAELQRLPLVGAFLTEERVKDLRAAAARGVLSRKDEVLAGIETAVRDGIDVRQVVERKVAAFEVTRLETLILEVASRELRSIEVLGGFLGLAVGLAQAAVLTIM